MAFGIDGTKLCAFEGGCNSSRINAFDLCHTHYQSSRSRGELPPRFRRVVGKHALVDVNPATKTAFCTGCNTTVRTFNNNRPVCSVSATERQRLRNTGWSQQQYDEALIAQANRCALCGNPPGQGGLHADHCHSKRTTRKLLCYRCNAALGYFLDNPETLRRAIPYLEGNV